MLLLYILQSSSGQQYKSKIDCSQPGSTSVATDIGQTTNLASVIAPWIVVKHGWMFTWAPSLGSISNNLIMDSESNT